MKFHSGLRMSLAFFSLSVFVLFNILCDAQAQTTATATATVISGFVVDITVTDGGGDGGGL